MKTPHPRRGGVMTALKRNSDALPERGLQLVMDLAEQPGGPGTNGASLRVGEKLGLNGDTLRNWVRRAGVDSGNRASPPRARPDRRIGAGGPRRATTERDPQERLGFLRGARWA